MYKDFFVKSPCFFAFYSWSGRYTHRCILIDSQQTQSRYFKSQRFLNLSQLSAIFSSLFFFFHQPIQGDLNLCFALKLKYFFLLSSLSLHRHIFWKQLQLRIGNICLTGGNYIFSISPHDHIMADRDTYMWSNRNSERSVPVLCWQ